MQNKDFRRAILCDLALVEVLPPAKPHDDFAAGRSVPVSVGVDMISSFVPGIPDLDRLIRTGRGDAAAVGAERHGKDGLSGPQSVSVSCPDPVSQTLTVLSSLAEAMRRPSGLNATPLTAPVCPGSVIKSEWQSRLR